MFRLEEERQNKNLRMKINKNYEIYCSHYKVRVFEEILCNRYLGYGSIK
jgi:hypothetical protein